MLKSYERQHLAAYAAGFISALGETTVTFGCGMTQIGLGKYGVVLPDDANLPDNESFTFVTTHGGNFLQPVFKMVADTSNRLKTISLFDFSTTPVNRNIEVVLFRSVTR